MWHIKRLEDMSSLDFYRYLRLRIDTFVVEQKRIYHELDDYDLESLHVYHENEDGRVDAYARVYIDGDVIEFGRVVTDSSIRGTGLGNQLVEYVLQACDQLASDKDIIIFSQAYVAGFYEKFGFVTVGDPFIFESTPHIKMILKR